MYPVSNAFHTAVAAGEKQKAMLIFPDMVFTDEDINVEKGIEFHDTFNLAENLSIGQATSNEISFSLFNDDRLLNNYEFGDFTALLGVRTGTAAYTGSETARVAVGNNVYTCHNTTPYIRKNGTGLAAQPGFEVISLMVIDDSLYCFGKTGNNGVVYSISGGGIVTDSVQPHMIRKAQRRRVGMGMVYSTSTRMMTEYFGGKAETYEFAPLGKFTAERPKAPDVILIDLTCYDFMQKFEEDMPSASTLGITYPVTIRRLYRALCDYVEVSYDSLNFINSTATITKEPDDFQNATMRDVIKWIAEAAGSNARFNRDGVLEMAWIRSTAQQLTATKYGVFNPYWYETRQVTKLYNRDTQSGSDTTYGTGDEGYLIQDNPLLRGVS